MLHMKCNSPTYSSHWNDCFENPQMVEIWFQNRCHYILVWQSVVACAILAWKYSNRKRNRFDRVCSIMFSQNKNSHFTYITDNNNLTSKINWEKNIFKFHKRALTCNTTFTFHIYHRGTLYYLSNATTMKTHKILCFCPL